jgi:tetratricopeptide (TPR) repeat protein
MFTMQNARNKIALIAVLCVAPLFTSHALPAEVELSKADSLFAAKKYTQAHQAYASLLARGYQSPAMLLRMAYIEEGMQHYPLALYYLHKAYLLHPNEKIWQKIQHLAQSQQATGYNRPLPEVWYARYAANSAAWIAVNLVLVALFALWVWMARKPALRRWLVGMQVVWAGLLVLQLHAKPYRYAVVQADVAPLMRGPSAASGVETTLTAGCRVRVLGKTDVWVRVATGPSQAKGYVLWANLLML